MAIDWSMTIIFTMAGLLSLYMSWDTKVRPIAWALLGSIAFSTVVMVVLPHYVGIEDAIQLEPAVFSIAEIGVFLTAMFCLLDCPKHAGAIMVLNLTSCVVSLAYPQHRGDMNVTVYEEVVNIILAIECLVQINVRLWRYVGDCFWRHLRHRNSRRRAKHALLRFRMAADTTRKNG